MSEIVTKITHQVMVPNFGLRELFTKTERVLTRSRAISLLPEFIYVPTISIDYLFVGEVKGSRQLETFCYEQNVKPLHPAFMAADCLSRPAFNDNTPAMTYWFDDDGLFCLAKFSKLFGHRTIDFDCRGVFLYDQPEGHDGWWLATTAAK